MFAVIRTGGKQYRVAKDDKITVEKLAGDPGVMVELSDVLMIGGAGQKTTVGAPLVDKAAVFAEVLEQSRADKIIVFKKNRRKNYRRTKGHRQEQTVLRILDVSPTGTKPKAEAKAKAAPKKDDKPPVEKKVETKAKEKPAAKEKEVKKEAKAPAAKKPAAKKPAAKKPAAKKKAPAKGKSKE
ncbi:MAG: 50S ribosomal protein L21 [Rhodospirillales bacterium]|nr:50S ribosomal protein L21 [Rhodospirillales bacterium]